MVATKIKDQLRGLRERTAVLNLAVHGARERGIIADGFEGEAVEASIGWLYTALIQLCDEAGVDEVPAPGRPS